MDDVFTICRSGQDFPALVYGVCLDHRILPKWSGVNVTYAVSFVDMQLRCPLLVTVAQDSCKFDFFFSLYS